MRMALLCLLGLLTAASAASAGGQDGGTAGGAPVPATTSDAVVAVAPVVNVDGSQTSAADTTEELGSAAAQAIGDAERDAPAASYAPSPLAQERPPADQPPRLGPAAGIAEDSRALRRSPPASQVRQVPASRERPRGVGVDPLNRPHTVAHRASAPPVIDGRLDDAVWTSATHITEFVQMSPVEGAPGSEVTEAWIAYDDDQVYVAFYAHYRDPRIMRINRAERDEIRGDDSMAVLFDPFLDQQRAYQFQVNGYGVQSDSIVNVGEEGGSPGSQISSRVSGTTSGSSAGRPSGGGSSSAFGIRGDDSWDALFYTGGQLVEDGWTAEMAIPFKSLRYPARGAGVPHQWGFQITRVIRGKSESVVWAPVSRAIAGPLTQMGVLDGLTDLSTSRNLEFLPTLTATRIGSLDSAGTFDAGDPDGEAGLGIKYGVTPNLTADFTYNPDFSQIESDRPQIETNQRFALFFPEQRPFFLEGQEIFNTSTQIDLVHTRAIVDPRYGAKLTGKVGNTTLGVVGAKDEAPGRLDDASDPAFGRTAQFVLGRVRYDFYSESYVGAIATVREFGEDYNRVGGVDGRFRLGRTHSVSFLAVGSDHHDAVRGSLSGPVVELDFRSRGRNLGYGLAYSRIDPEFRSLSGFIPRVDMRQTTANASYRWWPEQSLVTWGPTFSYLRNYNHEGILEDEQIQGQVDFEFRNNVRVTGTVSRDLERFGGIDFEKTGYSVFGLISRRVVSLVAGANWGDGVFFGSNPYLGRATGGNFLFSVRPTSRLRAELTGVFSRFVDARLDEPVFDVRIFRTRSTYQFTDRLLLRHILEHNTAADTVGNNLLLTYRINTGTVFFLGYDDRYQQGLKIPDTPVARRGLERTNRAFFTKIAYLFRY
jgi:hypothetical protein